MKETLFRKKSLERISSPDQLDEYIRVSSPAAWSVLALIVLLLVAAALWACFGTIDERVGAPLVVRDGAGVAYVPESSAERIEAGDVVEFSAGGEAYTGAVVSVAATLLSSEEVRAAAGDWTSLNIGGEAWARPVQVEVSAPDGTYDAAVVAESYNPVSLVFGG